MGAFSNTAFSQLAFSPSAFSFGTPSVTPESNFDVEGTIDASDTSTTGIITAIQSVSGTIDDTPTSVIGLIE